MHWRVSRPVSELEEVDNCRQLEGGVLIVK